MGEDPRFTPGVVNGLAYEGYRVRHIVPGARARKVKADRYEVDFSSEESVGELSDLLKSRPDDNVGTIISFLGAGSDPGGPSEPQPLAFDPSLATLHITKAFLEDLKVASAEGHGAFWNITTLDGGFGLRARDSGSVRGSGTLGFAKVLKRENPSLRVRNIDLDPSGDSQVILGRFFEELQTQDEELEIGLDEKGRWTLRLSLENGQKSMNRMGPLDPEAVVLVTGGARGVTAEVAKAMAVGTPCRFVLVGRSALPGEEDERTRGLDRTGLRDHFVFRMRETGQRLVPGEIESLIQRVLKDREITETLRTMQSAGASVEYHSLDVSDGVAFGRLLDDVYLRLGRLDGVVHGAGIIEDKLIPQKTTESFERVFRTKVDSADTLAQRLHPDSLKFLVFFSSVSARFGNAGQCDYSAANEHLNKLAVQLNRAWPGRVVSINWGPWDSGMVSDDLRRLYAERGISLIPVQTGVQACLDEIGFGPDAPAEVTIACGLSRLLPENA